MNNTKRSLIITSFASLTVILMVSFGLKANPQIMMAMKGGKRIHFATRNGKTVNQCTYCHSGTGIKQAKQGYRKGQSKYNSLKNIAKCAGSGCHH